jgi:hypothetical protein
MVANGVKDFIGRSVEQTKRPGGFILANIGHEAEGLNNFMNDV